LIHRDVGRSFLSSQARQECISSNEDHQPLTCLQLVSCGTAFFSLIPPLSCRFLRSPLGYSGHPGLVIASYTGTDGSRERQKPFYVADRLHIASPRNICLSRLCHCSYTVRPSRFRRDIIHELSLDIHKCKVNNHLQTLANSRCSQSCLLSTYCYAYTLHIDFARAANHARNGHTSSQYGDSSHVF
jgi:hypothetical protein